MKKNFLISAILPLIFSCFIFSCKSLPKIEPNISLKNHRDFSPFLKTSYQLTHSIKAELPNGDSTLLIGVTIVKPDYKSLNAVIMTVEGLVLCDVSFADDTLVINRSIPEFESSGFTQGLTDDLKLIYFQPDCAEFLSGELNGRPISRYKCKGKTSGEKIFTIDIATDKDNIVEIRKYNSSNSTIRTVNITLNRQGLPEKIELISHGLFGYSLFMELISAEKL